MNYTRFEKFMRTADDEILEWAQAFRKPTGKKNIYRIAAGIAACLALAVGMLTWHPWSRGAETISGKMDSTVTNPVHSSTEAELTSLGFCLPLPEGADNVCYSLIDSGDGTGAIAQATFSVSGSNYTYRTVKADEPTDISGIAGDFKTNMSWSEDNLRLCYCEDDTYVLFSWYSEADGTQWCLSTDSSTSDVIKTALASLICMGYDLDESPENVTDKTYGIFQIDDMVVSEVDFTLDGVRLAYRMAPTGGFDLVDISGKDGEFDHSAAGAVAYCDAKLFWNDDGTGKIIWFDVVPGLLYSLYIDSGADEITLTDFATRIFVPAQGDAG